MDVKHFRVSGGLTVRQMVAELRKEYPGYSKITHCMVENPGRYGVKLVPNAEERLADAFPASVRRADRHRNRHRLYCRLSELRYEEVKQAIEDDGRFSSVQAWLEWWISVYLRNKKAASSVTSTESGGVGNNSTKKIAQSGGDVNDGS